MSRGNLAEAANVVGKHGYTLVSKDQLELIKTKLSVVEFEELGVLFEIAPVTPMVELHPDDVRALIDYLEDSPFESSLTIQETLQEHLEATHGA